ncbi:MAG: hypothetical protein ACPL3B_07445, partial [Fervidobacterium sp.]
MSDRKHEVRYLFSMVLLVLTFGVLGVILPYVPLKVVLSFLSLVSFAYIIRHYSGKMAAFIFLGVLLFLIPMANIKT